jgi:hypothetical protein
MNNTGQIHDSGDNNLVLCSQQIYADVVGVIVNRGELGSIVARSLNGNSERSSLTWIDVELADEFAVFREFHDLAGLVHIGVHGIAVASD